MTREQFEKTLADLKYLRETYKNQEALVNLPKTPKSATVTTTGGCGCSKKV